MFSLIITLIAIVLVAALIGAVIYYGGSSFTESQATASAARVLNEGAQISGAATVYHSATGTYATNIEELVTSQYLQASPGPRWHTFQNSAIVTGLEQDQCEALNLKSNISGIPSCDDPAIAGRAVCCSQVTP